MSIERERKVDLDKFSPEDAGRISEELGAKVASLANKAREEITALLSIYGFEADFTVNFYKKQTTKKGRPKKV